MNSLIINTIEQRAYLPLSSLYELILAELDERGEVYDSADVFEETREEYYRHLEEKVC